MDAFGAERRRNWQKLIECTDMTHTSRKATDQRNGSMIRKLSKDTSEVKKLPSVTANQIGHQLLPNGKRPLGTQKHNQKMFGT